QESSCFGKLRLACSLDQVFSDILDILARTIRVDKMKKVIEEKVPAVCNQEESDETLERLQEELSESSIIVKQVVHGLSDFDSDRLNIWSNLNDTLSERNFFLEKFRDLKAADSEVLTTSLNSIISRLVNSEPPTHIATFVQNLSKENITKLS
ncbi:hypothetical protein PFISCL1PPCAC_11546, partial [Pristionchus fissidentatus]